jgi:NUMOD3 motif
MVMAKGQGVMPLCHEGSDYPGFMNNEARREYEQILLRAHERFSPLSSNYRPTANSTVEADLENIAEFADDDRYTEQHHPLPQSLGGTKDGRSYRFVTINLTAQEHFRVHQLLPEFTVGEDRRKMQHALACMIMKSDAHKGRIFTSEQYAIARQAAREAGVSPEHRAKLSAANRGKTLSLEHRAAISAYQRGRSLTPEHLAARTGRKRTAEARENMSRAQLRMWKRRKEQGWTHSAESLAKMSGNAPRWTCTTCNITGRSSNITRYHSKPDCVRTQALTVKHP